VKRKILMIVLFVALAALMFAAPVKIRFWHMYQSGPSKEVMEEIIAEFNEKFEGTIVVEDLGISFWDYWDKIRVAMASGSEPDVFLHDMGNVGMRASQGILLNLKPYLDAYGMSPEEIFFDGPLEMCSYEGGVYAFPLETDVRLLFYNKGLFEEAGINPDEPPETWTQLWEYADEITTVDEKGHYDVIGFNPIYGQSYFWMYVWGKGHSFIDDEGNIKVNSPGIIEDLTEWVAMVEKLGNEELQAFGSSYGWGAADGFIAGKLGMVIQVGNFIANLEQYNPDLDYGITHIPYPEEKATWSNGFSLEVSSRTNNKAEVMEFVMYLISEEVQLKLAENLSSLIGNREAAYNNELMEDPTWKLQIQALEYTKFRPFVLEAPLWYEHLQVAVEEAQYGNKTPEDALNHAQKMIDMEIQKYRLTH